MNDFKVTDPASEEAAQVRKGWAYRLIEVLRGNQTLTGALVIAIANRAPENPPRILCGGVVNQDGLLVVAFESRRNPGIPQSAALGHIDCVRDEFRKICDEIKLPDEEREKFFDEFRKWIARDLRTEAAMVHPEHPTLQ